MADQTPDGPGKGVPAPWNYYYLRYFVGAIVGAGLLVALWAGDPKVLPSFQHTFPPVPHEWAHLAAVIAALGTAGLAYCYIASSPILLMHGLRFRFAQEEGWWRALRWMPFVAVGLLVVFAWNYGATAPSSFRNDPWGQMLLFVPYGIIVLLQFLGLPWGRLGVVRDHYNTLARQRARWTHEQWAKEYVESYRHLREHGNALLIILMEIILAAALYAAGGCRGSCRPFHTTDTTIRFFTIAVIWIVPATFCWFLGTWLEFGILPSKTNSLPAEKLSFTRAIRRRICKRIQSWCADEKSEADEA